MPLTVINGKSGAADVTIDAVSYKCILDMFRVREVTEMTASDTFCSEGDADQEPGRSQLQFELGGLGTFDDAPSGPLIPAPQNVPVVLTAHTGCLVTLDANFSEASLDRLVNQNARIGARGMSKGAYTVTWDDGTP